METNQEKSAYAAESPEGYGESPPGEGKLVRQLKNRHVAMIRYANFSLYTCK
jgi:hypothetical protein